MPQVFHVGYRSPWVDALAWLLMSLALAGLLLSAWKLSIAMLPVAAWSAMALAIGQALLRRFGWGWRLARGLLPWLLMPSLTLALWPDHLGLLWTLVLAAGSALLLRSLLLVLDQQLVRHEFG